MINILNFRDDFESPVWIKLRDIMKIPFVIFLKKISIGNIIHLNYWSK
jgi:hypothetical protein